MLVKEVEVLLPRKISRCWVSRAASEPAEREMLRNRKILRAHLTL